MEILRGKESVVSAYLLEVLRELLGSIEVLPCHPKYISETCVRLPLAVRVCYRW